MRTPLPATRPNGHGPAPGRVFVISGMCADPHFRLRFQGGGEEFCLIFLGAPGLGGAAESETEGEPYFVLRRLHDGGQAVAVVRVDWEGVFALFSNDDGLAEELFQELIAPSSPDEVSREWSEEDGTLRLFADLIWMQ